MVLPIRTSVSREVIECKEFNPSDSCNFDVSLGKRPLPFFEESMRFFLKDLAVGKPVLAFCGWDGLEVVVFKYVMFFVPYRCLCFHPFFGFITKDGFLHDQLFFSFLCFSLGDPYYHVAVYA